MKIGVFDSGLGGLTVVQAMTKVIKGAEIFYVADTKNAPYGEKSPEEILQFSLNITHFLRQEHEIDALVIACNTATSAAITAIREQFPELIIIGSEPGIKPAFEQTKTGNVGVLATPATLIGEKYHTLSRDLAAENTVTLHEQACPGLVEQIECGEIDSPKTKAMLETWLAPMRQSDVDTIVLGCTHYPLVSEIIACVMQCDVTLIHTGNAIAKRLLFLGTQKGHVNEGDLSILIYATGKIKYESIKNILKTSPEMKHIHL